MKRYLLDTSLLAAYLHNRAPAISLISLWVKNDEAATSMLVYGEVIEYLKGLPQYHEKFAAFHTLLKERPPYQLTYAILERYADILYWLLGTSVGKIANFAFSSSLSICLARETRWREKQRCSSRSSRE
jgi:hypothetical protein